MPSQELDEVVRLLFDLQPAGAMELSLSEERDAFEDLWRRFPPQAGVETELIDAGGVPAAWLVAPDSAEDRVVVFLHGGGFRVGSVRSHLAITSRLAAASGARVLAVEYRLVPEHRFPAQLEDALAASVWLLDQGIRPQRLTIAGDSAGGGLAVAAALSLRDQGRPLPACLALLCPWTDLVGGGASRDLDPALDPTGATVEAVDQIAAAYLDGADAAQPLASPVYADLTGFPPMLIQAATRDLLFPDSTRLAARAREDGVDTTLEVEQGAFHVWHHAAPDVPEARAAIERVGAFVRQHTHS